MLHTQVWLAAFLGSLLLAKPSWGTAKSPSWELGFLPTVFYCGLPVGKIDNRLGLKARSSAVPGYKERRTLVRSGAQWTTVLCQCPQSCQFMVQLSLSCSHLVYVSCLLLLCCRQKFLQIAGVWRLAR